MHISFCQLPLSFPNLVIFVPLLQRPIVMGSVILCNDKEPWESHTEAFHVQFPHICSLSLIVCVLVNPRLLSSLFQKKRSFDTEDVMALSTIHLQ